jgi:hypothetical protein
MSTGSLIFADKSYTRLSVTDEIEAYGKAKSKNPLWANKVEYKNGMLAGLNAAYLKRYQLRQGDGKPPTM